MVRLAAIAAGLTLVMHGCAAIPGSGGDASPEAGISGARPFVFSPAPGDGSVPFPTTDSLVVVSWNVHVGGGDLPALVADLRSGELTGGAPPAAWVILVQEAHRWDSGLPMGSALLPRPGQSVRPIHNIPPSGRRQDVVAIARELELHLAYAPAVPNGRAEPDAPREDRGVAILSSHAMEGFRVVELPRERQRRVALAGIFRGYGAGGEPWEFELVSAHLENRSRWGRVLDSFGAGRARQARYLADRIGDGPAVLGGDLNTWAPSFLEPTMGILDPLFPHTPDVEGATYLAAGIPRRLDHLLFRLPDRGTARVRIVEDLYGSDHRPVIGVVGIPSSG